MVTNLEDLQADADSRCGSTRELAPAAESIFPFGYGDQGSNRTARSVMSSMQLLMHSPAVTGDDLGDFGNIF